MSDNSTEEVEYSLLVSFPDQSESFVLGFEAGGISEWMKAMQGESSLSLTTHVKNREVITRMAAARGCTVSFTPYDDTYDTTDVERKASTPDIPRRPMTHLRIVE